MRKYVSFFYFIFLLFGRFDLLQAQQKQNRYIGKLYGGIDVNTAFYKKDKLSPELDKRGINTWLNLNYEYERFTAGVQYEIFRPPLRGYSEDLKGNKLMQYFVSYGADKFNVVAGNFYEQFGSGLIFRSYEERSLGVNTSLRGVNLKYTPWEWMNFKAFAGRPRRYLEYADAWIYGVDGDFLLSRLWSKGYDYSISVGGSWVLRHNTKTFDISPESANVNLYGIRTVYNGSRMNIGIEYTAKGRSQSYSFESREYVNQSGDALLVNMDYTCDGFGVSGVFRRLEHMEFRVDNKPELLYIPLNYLPALTKQHKYALPALYPHVANAEGEIGGQLDMFGDVDFSWMGKYPLKMTLNLSWYRSLGENLNKTMPFFGDGGEDLFREASLELDKKFGKVFKAVLGCYFQESGEIGEKGKKSYIFITDLLWKPSRRISLRSEIQHMSTKMMDKAWIYGLLEVGFAPFLMVYVSDMHNYGADDSEHFYNVGAALTYKSLRTSVAYGKNREGYQCTGGICRFVPGYTGLSLSLAYVF